MNSLSWRTTGFGAAEEFPPFAGAAGGDQKDERDKGEGDHGVEAPDGGLAQHLGGFGGLSQGDGGARERAGAAQEAELGIGGKDFQVGGDGREMDRKCSPLRAKLHLIPLAQVRPNLNDNA